MPVMHMTRAGLHVVALAGLLLAAGRLQAAVVIDDFDLPQPADRFFILGPPGMGDPNPTLIQRSAPGILGGQRDVLIVVVDVARPASANGLIGFDDDSQLGALQLQTHAPGTILTLQYDGIDADTTDLNDARGLSADLTQGLIGTGILIDFLSVDTPIGPGLQLEIDITSSGGSASYSDLVAESDGPFTYFAPYGQFSLLGQFSLTAVESITLRLNGRGDPHVDFEIDAIRAGVIPEPTSCLLFGLAACYPLVHGWRGRRRPHGRRNQPTVFSSA
jgi:hypothetical protein